MTSTLVHTQNAKFCGCSVYHSGQRGRVNTMRTLYVDTTPHCTLMFQVAEEVLGDLVDDPAGLADYLQRMGRLHERRGVSRRNLDALGPCLIRAIRPILQERGTILPQPSCIFCFLFSFLVACSTKIVYLNSLHSRGVKISLSNGSESG